MPKPPSDTARRARDLLDKKIAQDLPSAGRIQGAARARTESSSDAFFSALVEGAFLVAAADGELSQDEESTLSETIGYVTGEALGPEEFMAMIDSFAAALGDDGRDARLAAVARSVPDVAARREVLAFSALIALCDRQFDDREKDTLAAMGRAFSLPDDAVSAIVEAVNKNLG